MATRSDTVTVADDAVTRLDASPASSAINGASLLITNNGTEILWIGAADVTAADGTPIAPGAQVSVTVFRGDEIYGISDDGDLNVRVLQVGG